MMHTSRAGAFAAAGALLMSAVPALAGPTAKTAAKSSKKPAAAAMYACSKCHMKFSAADAKKDHFKDPMDGGTLVAVKTAGKTSSQDKKPGAMGKMKGM